MPVEQSEHEGATMMQRGLRVLLWVATVILAGTQLAIATLEWQFRTSSDGSNGAAVPHVIAAVLLLAGVAALRLAHVRLRRIMILVLGIMSIYYIGPGTLYFDSLGIGHTPSVIDFPTVLVVGLYLLTPLLMLVLAFVLFKGLPVRVQPPCTESSFLHRRPFGPESEWKPDPKPSTGEPVTMPVALRWKLAVLILLGTGIAFAVSFPLSRKAGALYDGWYNPYIHPDELHYSVLHPVALFVGMFVVIAALWKVAAHRRMGRVLLGLAIGMQALLGIGLIV